MRIDVVAAVVPVFVADTYRRYRRALLYTMTTELACQR